MIEEALSELATYLDWAGGHIAPEVEARARDLLGFAGQRMRAGEQTVVALAGATGSGKSSLTNAISGSALATVAARRPTTSAALAVSFSATNSHLLDLLQVPHRREAAPPVEQLRDVVLLDLPDHDSTQRAHRAEVDRLVRLVDQFVFVVDPQKYADNALHERYLRPLAGHREVITVVLNHADGLTDGAPFLDGDALDPRVADVVEHLRTLLETDGLTDVPIFATNATTGEGVDLLRRWLGHIAARKAATRERLAADLRGVVVELERDSGKAEGLHESHIEELKCEVRAAAGVQRMARSVRAAVRQRGAMLQQWGRRSDEPLALPSHQVASAADDARASQAIRKFVSSSTACLPERWREQTRREVMQGPARRLPALVDQSMRGVDLSGLEMPFGWGLVRVLKWLPVVAVLGIAGWVVYQLAWGMGDFGVRVITILAASLAAVVALSLLGDGFLCWMARRAERATRRRLSEAVDEQIEQTIIATVQGELETHVAAESARQRMAGILARGEGSPSKGLPRESSRRDFRG